MARQPSSWEDRLEVENGKIVRIVQAVYDRANRPYSEIDVYKETEDGEYFVRNLYSSMYGGYCVAFPGYPKNESYWAYDAAIVEEPDEWEQIDKPRSVGLGWSTEVFPEDKNRVVMYHYDFKYLMNKYELKSKSELMEKLRMWKKHPEIELMLAAGYERLAMNGNLYRMKNENRKKIMKFCRENPDCNDFTLLEIQQCIKASNLEDMKNYIKHFSKWERENDYTMEDFKYMAKKKLLSGAGKNLYYDYKRLLRNSPHDENSDYWKYPANLEKCHAKLVAEDQRRRELENKKEREKEARKYSLKTCDFQKVVKRYQKYNGEVDGYQIYFSNDYNDWCKQADALHQCIVAAHYMSKVASKQCLIAFIRKDGEPVATVEIKPGKQLGQFYANELDRDNCLPSEEVKNVFNKWFENVKIRRVI